MSNVKTYYTQYSNRNIIYIQLIRLGIKYKFIISFSEPPSAPVISGLPENQALREGQTVHLTCSSLDGSPKPKLTWFKVNQDGSEETKIISKEMENAKKEYQKTKLIKSDNSDEESKAIHNKSNQGAKEHSIATIEIVASREDNTRLYRYPLILWTFQIMQSKKICLLK